VITPQVPGRRSIGQAVLHHQPNGGVNHAVRVVALGQGQILHVGVELKATSEAMMLRIGELNILWSTGDGIAQIVQPPDHRAKSISASSALRASSPRIAPTALADLRLGQILNTSDSFGHITNVPSWPGHGDILHESPSIKLSAKPAKNQDKYSVMML